MLPIIDTDPAGKLARTQLFALDMDGTVYLGEQWIPGAVEFLQRIKENGRRYCFLTNNSSKNPKAYVEKLSRMGLPATEEEIVTSGQATIYYLRQHYPGKRVFLLGNPILTEEFMEAGICLTDKDPEVVVTGFDTSLTYARMTQVCDFVRAGLPYIATHPDFNCPTETGFIPDIGAIAAFIEASAGRRPDKVVGKPNPEIAQYLMARVGIEDPSRIAMVGDRLYTDVAAGVRAGFTSVLVLSGEGTMADAEASPEKPELIFHSVREMIPYLAELTD